MSLTTGALNPAANLGSYDFRNAITANTKSNLFTAQYENSYGPTRENAAQLQHQEDIKNLAAEIAAKETPEAKSARDELGYFAKKSEEKSLQDSKDQLQKKIDDNALEVAIKADPYFLLAKQWDRYVIMAANGETVTLEMEDTSGETNADGNYPMKKIEITKSKRLKKISSGATPKKVTKTPASIRNDYEKKKSAIKSKYEKADSEGRKIFFGLSGAIMGGSSTRIAEYNKECSDLDNACEKEIAALANAVDTVPPSQGKNVEPHTIAIYAPGYCMESGCCLEKAFYTLRSACKAIEENAEAEAKNSLSDMYARRKELQDAVLSANKEVASIEEQAINKASADAVNAYQAALKDSTKVVVIGGKSIIVKTATPDPKKYEAAVWLIDHPEIYDDLNYQDALMVQDAANEELALFDEELNAELDTAINTLNNDAKNYRLLLDHCTFQPTCPEWLEDAGSSIASGAKATGEAISSAFSWSVSSVSSCMSTVSDAVNDSLAYVGDLQDQLNEVIGFQGLCSLNPFGGTLGCRNCPMGSDCNSQKDSLLGKIRSATANSNFLNNLNRALGLGKGQLLGNLLRCAAALTGEMTGVISAVADFSINKGMSSVLGPASSVLNTNSLPNFNTKVMDCISNTVELSEAKSAINMLNKTAKGPMGILQSNTPGLSSISPIDLSKIDYANTSSNYFTSSVLGADRSNMLSVGKNLVDYSAPSGSTQYYDGINVDNDSATRAMQEAEANGMWDYVDPAKQMEKNRNMIKGIPGGQISDKALALLA